MPERFEKEDLERILKNYVRDWSEKYAGNSLWKITLATIIANVATHLVFSHPYVANAVKNIFSKYGKNETESQKNE